MLARSLSLASLALLAGCSVGGPKEESADAAPIRVKTPPAPKQGTGSSPGCMGVPARGECVDNVATYCDVGADQIRRQDCNALGKECVIDAVRGATCQEEEQGLSCDTGLDYRGLCDGNVAIWCDTEKGLTVRWDCSAQDLTCGEDVCAEGAYCCGDEPPPPTNMCGELDYYGVCDGNTARWCDDGQIAERTCGEGESCQLDACAEGAYCCPTEQQPPNECEELGNVGECAGNVARWCNYSGEIVEIDCAMHGRECQVDGCIEGVSACCEPERTCEEIGASGECVGNTLRYCLNEEVTEKNCEDEGQVCTVDDTGFAACGAE